MFSNLFFFFLELFLLILFKNWYILKSKSCYKYSYILFRWNHKLFFALVDTNSLISSWFTLQYCLFGYICTFSYILTIENHSPLETSAKKIIKIFPNEKRAKLISLNLFYYIMFFVKKSVVKVNLLGYTSTCFGTSPSDFIIYT